MHGTYTIARLATAAGVHVETVRYYQRRGLVPEPARPPGGIRRYGQADADRLRFIRRAQTMGFSLTEIGSLLALKTRGSCRATRALAATKLADVDARMRELRRLRKDLAKLVARCDANERDASCPVIDRLARPEREPARSAAAFRS